MEVKMNTKTTIEQIRAFRANLPRGKKDPFGHRASKRMLLNKGLQRASYDEMTEGERSAVNEFLMFCEEWKSQSREFEKRAKKITQL